MKWIGIVCSIMLCTPCAGQKRTRVLFKNNASEDVYVALGNERLTPLPKYLIPLNTQKYRFPLIFDSHHPLHITLTSMSNSGEEIQYLLELDGNLDRARIRSCRAFGTIRLRRNGYAITEIGASSIETGLVLELTPDFDLTLSRIESATRPHAPKKRYSCKPCRPCS